MAAPSLAVPLPGGSPRPSAKTVMSCFAASCGVIGWPNFCAWSVTASRIRLYREDIAVRLYAPGFDAVVVVADFDAALGNELVAAGLEEAGFVGAARLDDGFGAVPRPRIAEADHGFVEDRLLQHGRLPGARVIGGDFDL